MMLNYTRLPEKAENLKRGQPNSKDPELLT